MTAGNNCGISGLSKHGSVRTAPSLLQFGCSVLASADSSVRVQGWLSWGTPPTAGEADCFVVVGLDWVFCLSVSGFGILLGFFSPKFS